MKLYVGNLPFNSSEEDVRQLFEQHGTVYDVALITDRDTGVRVASVLSKWTTGRQRLR
jgi:RNA recognition motif-containing protein